jgi:hypothetical protein
VNRVLEQLLSLYAEHGADGVRHADAFQHLCDEHGHEGESDFHKVRDHVEHAQRRLEKLLSHQTHREQVVQALKQLSRPAVEDVRPLYPELVRRGFARAWSEEQRAYFEMASEKFASWDDYFLSFTTHNPFRPDLNVLNVDHSVLIWVGMRVEVKSPEGSEQNLLAKLLHVRLHDEGLRGYYYPDQREDNDIAAALVERASGCFAFVQLVEPTLFQRYPNYCHMEYDAAAGDESRALVFVTGRPHEDFEAIEGVHDELFDWHDTMIHRQAVTLMPAATTDDAQLVLRRIKLDIAQRVRDARQRLYDDVPP